MEDTYISPFKNSFPVYVCPWCSNHVHYNPDIRFYANDCFYLEIDCLHCSQNANMKCSCNHVYPRRLCDKHDSSPFRIKISIKRGNYDIMIPPELLWKKQIVNMMRMMRMMNNAEQSKKIMFIPKSGNDAREGVDVIVMLNQYNDLVFSEVKDAIIGITYACLMYNLPMDIVQVLYKLMHQLILCDYY